MRQVLRRFSLIVALGAPTLLAAIWTCWPAAIAAWSAFVLPPINIAMTDWEDPTRMVELRRYIQRHFLNYSVYIPMEDIITITPMESPTGNSTPTSLLMQKACGRGRLFVWIPFKFLLPISGEKVIEWCWKPQTNDA